MQRWLIHVLLNIVIRYMAVIATGQCAKAALMIVGLELVLASEYTESSICHPFVIRCVCMASMVAGCS